MRAVEEFLFQYRTTPHTVTVETPAKLLMGRELRSRIPKISRAPPESEQQWSESMREREAMQNLRSKENADKARGVHSSTIDEGDLVLLQTLTPRSKIEPRFEIQPYKVIQRDGSAVLIENEEKGMKLRNTSQMKKYFNKPIGNETLTTEQTRDKTMYDEKSDVTNQSA